MAYRFDKGLEFLKNCSNSELQELLEILIYDKDGEIRLTEEITQNHAYIRHQPDHSKYWELIAAELQAFGGNTFATMFRGGKGVLYHEILCDVCKKLKVDFTKESPTKIVEWKFLQKITSETLEQMNEAERIAFLKEADFNLSNGDISYGSLSTATITTLLNTPTSYKIIVATANYLIKLLLGKIVVGSGVAIAVNASLGRAAGVLFGPIGWAASGVWLAADIAGAAYRVTTPAVIKVATLRLMHDKQMV